MAYWEGLIEGFQGRREAEFLKNYAREQANRQMADRVFQYLLQSRNPRMQELALSGLAQPIGRKKGLAGFMGEVESNPLFAQIIAHMNELVPEDGVGGGPAPPRPGSAGMSTNVPVQAGSQPIGLPGTPLAPEPPPFPMAEAGPAGDPLLGPAAGTAPGVGMAPPPAPPQLRRRGTGIPEAEDIAEANAAAQLRGTLTAGTEALARARTPEEKRMILARMGLPESRRLQPVNWGVRLIPGGPVVPVLLDPDEGYVTAGGKPIPLNAERVQQSGGPTVPRSAKEPDPQFDTGWARVFYDTATGEELYRVEDTPFVPPPTGAAASYFTQGPNGELIPVVLPRNAPPGAQPTAPPRAEPSAPSPTAVQARALLSEVKQVFAGIEAPKRMGQVRKPMTPAQRDEIVKQRAIAAGLPFRRYVELEQAAQQTVATQSTAAQAPAPSAAERVRRRLEQGGATAPAPPPARPPVRQTGPGPRQ